MDKITYLINVQVKLDGKVIGTIKQNKQGFAYHPKGNSKHCGETFATIEQVKKTLEER
jgi:hypothetical protein